MRTKLATIQARNVSIGIRGFTIESRTDLKSHSWPVRIMLVICSLNFGAVGFGRKTGSWDGVTVWVAGSGYLASNCWRAGAGDPSSGGIKGESVLTVSIRSFAVTGWPFMVPIGVCPLTMG